jgi:hypothetical protein
MNRFWTFESFIGSHGVCAGQGKYAFEFHLGSAEVIQIGWTSRLDEFNPYGGFGVGDFRSSYAFDGKRVCKWNGRDVDNDEYGIRWSALDTLTCLLDLDEGTISFLLNGQDLGIAFRNVDVNQTWYPVASLTCDQWGHFRFGSVLDKFLFCPPDYQPIPYLDEMFYSCIDFLPEDEISIEKVDNSETLLQPKDLSPVETRQIESFMNYKEKLSLFYEVRVGIQGADSNLCLAIGCISDQQELELVIFQLSTSKVIFASITGGDMDMDLFLDRDILEIFNESPEFTSPPQFVKRGETTLVLSEGANIGVGVDEVGGKLWFTHNGVEICSAEGLNISIASYIPYLRNIPRYLLNFGQYDFVSEIGNRLYSPSNYQQVI